MGNSASRDPKFIELKNCLQKPVKYESVLKFYDYVTSKDAEISHDYFFLEYDLKDRFLHDISSGLYKTKVEIEEIADLITRTSVKSRNIYDSDQSLNFIGR